MLKHFMNIGVGLILSISGCTDEPPTPEENRSFVEEAMVDFFVCLDAHSPNMCSAEEDELRLCLEEEVSFRGFCSADCGGGVSASCAGSMCGAKDGWGCSFIEKGQVKSVRCPAPKADTPMVDPNNG